MTIARVHNFACTVWLILAREGGWWTAREIIKELPGNIEASRAHVQLYVMAKRDGTLTVRGAQKQSEYAVTKDCKFPRGLYVEEMIDAFALRYQQSQEEQRLPHVLLVANG